MEEADKLRALLRRCRSQLIEHDYDNEHETPEELYRELAAVLDQADPPPRAQIGVD